MEIPKETSESKHHKIYLFVLAPLKMVEIVLKTPLLPPIMAEGLDKSRAARLHIIEAVKLMLSWMHVGPKDTYIEYCIKGERNKMWWYLVPEAQMSVPQSPHTL